MTRADLIHEIERVEDALRKTASRKLRSDYGKYLKRLRLELRYYDKHFDEQNLHKRRNGKPHGNLQGNI